MIVAIDGPSGTGKGTVARAVAQRLALVYFDTGAMYRAVTYFCLKEGVSIESLEEMEHLLRRFTFHIEPGTNEMRYFVSDEEVTQQIRTPEVTALAAMVSAIPAVRETLVEQQRRFAQGGGAIFEGRDIGTVVFPDADVKIFLTASPEVRAERRYKEWLGKGESVTYEEVLQAIESRDHLDSTRTHSPLRRAEDAILIDTSEMSVDEVVEAVARCITGVQGGNS